MFIEVSNILNQLYPKQYSKLNEIRQGLENDYEEEKKFVIRKDCNHTYKVIDETKDQITFKCQKCDRWIPYQKSNIWNSHQIEPRLKFGIYQKSNEIDSSQTISEILDISANCNFFDGKHQIHLKIKQNSEDILNDEPVEVILECILCKKRRQFIIGKDTMEKLSIDIESYIGSDIHSKILSSSLFKFILHSKKLSVNPDKITLKKLRLFGLYPNYLEHIKEFEKDKKIILKIFQKYKFISHIY